VDRSHCLYKELKRLHELYRYAEKDHKKDIVDLITKHNYLMLAPPMRVRGRPFADDFGELIKDIKKEN